MINVSERDGYTLHEFFRGKSTAYLMPDHTAPNLINLFKIAQEGLRYL